MIDEQAGPAGAPMNETEQAVVRPMNHNEAMDALIGCAATVTLLSYEEFLLGYFKLRGLDIP